MIIENHEKFWDDEGRIVPSALYEFFRVKGIGKYYPNEEKWKNTGHHVVSVRGNVVSIVNTNFLIRLALDHIDKHLQDLSIRERVLNSFHRSTSLFSERNQMLLPELKLSFLTDTKEAAFFFFKNVIVEVTASEIKTHDYADFDQFVWEESIKEHVFTIADELDLQRDCEFKRFLSDMTVVEDIHHAQNRLLSLKSALGYLIHRFKDGKTTRAIILMDVFVDGSPNGGSGKTLLARSLEKVRILSLLNGKIYDKKEWFSLSAVDLNSDIILFDDVDKNFDFESIFNMMTTSLEVRIPRKGHITIPHEKSPKVIISTNYSVPGDSDSFRRRKFEFEVSATFNADYTPFDRYGHMLFDDWEKEQWNYFYNTLFTCVKIYLSQGLVKSEPINIKLSKIIHQTNEDFVDFAVENFEAGGEYNKKESFDSFVQAYPGNRLSLREFTAWMKCWASYKGFGIKERHSDNNRYMAFVQKPA